MPDAYQIVGDFEQFQNIDEEIERYEQAARDQKRLKGF